MKLLKYLLSIFFITSSLNVFATTATWVQTAGLSGATYSSVTVNGLTSSNVDANAVTKVYFEYGTNINNLTSTTPLLDVSSLSLDSNNKAVFSANITGLVPNVYNYFRAVRKITYNDNLVPEYVRGQIYQLVPPVENIAPEIKAVVPYVGQACVTDSCNISIPENLSVNNMVAKIYAQEQNINQSLSIAIIGGNTNNAFYIDGLWQVRVINKSLIDFETINSFNLVIEVRDNGTPQKTDTVNLHITITDVVNENVSDATFGVNSVTGLYGNGYVSGGSSVPYTVSGNVPTYSSIPSIVNPTVGYLVNSNISTYNNNSSPVSIPIGLYNSSTYSDGSTYNNTSSFLNQNLNYVYGSINNPTFGSLGYLNNSNTVYSNTGDNGSTYNNTGTGIVSNVNYYNPIVSSQQNLTEQQRQQELQSILAIMIALKAEIDRRVALGIQ